MSQQQLDIFQVDIHERQQQWGAVIPVSDVDMNARMTQKELGDFVVSFERRHVKWSPAIVSLVDVNLVVKENMAHLRHLVASTGLEEKVLWSVGH